MCGIFGIVFKDLREDLGQILLQAGRKLTYRGYDSVGMVAFSDGTVDLRKDVGEIEEVNKKYKFEELQGLKGIAQLRWATFGPPSQKNSQPHFDCTKTMVGAHNGNIVNTRELIAEYRTNGHVFQGENDGEYVEYSHDSFQVRNLADGEEVERAPQPCPMDIEIAQKGEYAHFMLKEIHEQPEKARALINFLEESKQARDFCEALQGESRIYLVGSGSSYNACVLGAYYLNKMAGVEVIPVIAGAFKEFLGQSDFSQDTFILVSQSGETKDVITVLNYLEEKLAQKILAVVNVLGSSLQLRVKNHLPLLSNIEISVPATKTFTNQVIIFLYLARKLAESRGRAAPLSREDFLSLPSLIQKTLDEKEEACRQIAAELAGKSYLYYLGYGISYGACLEAALKMKEITYIPCEGMYSSEFKHGPLAIINREDWVLFLSTVEDAHMTLSHINEVSCRWGKICTISPENKGLEMNSDKLIALPTQDYFLSPLLAVVVAQMIGYYVSREKGINPDQPRNISKTLTVD